MSKKQLTLEQALHCAKCKAKAQFVEEHCGSDFAPGEILLISCPSTFCKERPWFYCCSCKTKCYTNGLDRHAKRKRHQELHATKYRQHPDQPQPAPPANSDNCEIMPIFPGDGGVMEICNDNDEALNEVVGMDEIAFTEAMDQELAATCLQGGQSTMEVVAPKQSAANSDQDSQFPDIDLNGNNWLANALEGSPIATAQELYSVFARPELANQKNFWVAELGSGYGKCGGGLSYLAARAFQQVKDSQLDSQRYPDYEESKWQLHNLIQYQSMNDKQRFRQSGINETLMQCFPTNKFFKHTFLPLFNQLGKFYGDTGQHSMWNNLPCPVPIDVDGVAYVPLRAIIAFLMANAIPIDDIAITRDDAPAPADVETDRLRRVHHVDQSQKAVDWFRDIHDKYYNSNSGAPNSNSGAPKRDTVICLYLSDWKDGFDTAKVKSNRNSIDTKTFTVSPPKCLVNGTDNTFPVAIGLKKSTDGWNKVEAMFRSELEELTKAEEPIPFYHGGTQKIVYCFFKHFATLSDKQERNGLTGTLGCGSDIHRCFGVSGRIETPSCDLPKMEEFLANERLGLEKGDAGWSAEMIVGTKNGAVFPACKHCRMQGLKKLFQMELELNHTRCGQCRNWDLIDPNSTVDLDFDCHKSYPKTVSEGSPVVPPQGRDVFGPDTTLPFLEITWDVMKQGCKFAFYQASRSKNAWNKATTLCYLKHCGISVVLATELYSAARECCNRKEQDNVDYSRSDGIGGFQFHPAWRCNDISLKDFIEATMHQLFLGAAESNHELISLWMASSPAGAKLAHSSFLQVLQVLIKDLRGFRLSWLLAYPLTGKKGSLGTGSWVAENWIFLVRISQFVFGWCTRDYDTASKYGVEDMSRVVIAFHAFVARCLTHSGIDGNSIDEAELYLKEFLSALREFDIRVRHQKHNKDVRNFSERKGTEAWWLKPNYMSLSNLVAMMRVIGPLVLWWDGGGKGERFIQLIKPYIKKGIREDCASFFNTLLRKLYQFRQLDLFEKRYGITPTHEEGSSEGVEDGVEDEEDGDDGTTVDSSEEDDTTTGSLEEDDEDEDEEDDEKMPALREEDAHFSTNEVYGMTKTKTIYVYRNEEQLKLCVASLKPIAGIVQVSVNHDGETAFEFSVVFRKPVKQFARRKVTFLDEEGVKYHGLWCAGIQVEDQELVPPTTDFKAIQSCAQLSAVAIPLWYIIGSKDHINSNKYCVITNWWKYRMSDGSYRLPFLDGGLYNTLETESFFLAATKAQEDYDSVTEGPTEFGTI